MSQKVSKIRKINSTSPNLTWHSLFCSTSFYKNPILRLSQQCNWGFWWDVTNCLWTEAEADAFLCPLKHQKTLTQQCRNINRKNKNFTIKIQNKSMGDAYMSQSQKHSQVPKPNKIYVNFCCYHTARDFFCHFCNAVHDF